MLRAASTTIALLLCLPACLEPQPGYRCDAEGLCPDGLSCVDGLCVDEGADAGADAGAQEDAGGQDAGAFTPADWVFWVYVIRDRRLDRDEIVNVFFAEAELLGTDSYYYFTEQCWFSNSATFDPLHGLDRVPHAGRITAATPGKETVETVPGEQGPYQDSTSYWNIPGWAPGDAITIHAEGGDVPGFEETLLFPGPTLPTSHDLESDVTLTMDPAGPIVVTWEPISDNVWIRFRQWSGYPATTRTIAAICEVPGTLGSFEFPVEILAAEFDTSVDHDRTVFSFGTRAIQSFRAGDWEVRIEPVNLTTNLVRFDQ